MTQIASEDYVNKRIYLHADTVTSGFDPAVMQQEHRALRRLNANDERNQRNNDDGRELNSDHAAPPRI